MRNFPFFHRNDDPVFIWSWLRSDSHQAPKKRSKTVILVKNLEAKTDVSELRELFSVHGEVGRVLLPPHGVTAIVEFLEPTEAKAAFRKLAYSKFRHIPLYLEWAPVDLFRTAQSSQTPTAAEGSVPLITYSTFVKIFLGSLLMSTYFRFSSIFNE